MEHTGQDGNRASVNAFWSFFSSRVERVKKEVREKKLKSSSHHHSESSSGCEYSSGRRTTDYKVDKHDKRLEGVNVYKWVTIQLIHDFGSSDKLQRNLSLE